LGVGVWGPNKKKGERQNGGGVATEVRKGRATQNPFKIKKKRKHQEKWQDGVGEKIQQGKRKTDIS